MDQVADQVVVVPADLLEQEDLEHQDKGTAEVHPLVLVYLETIEGLEVVAHLRLAITDKQMEMVVMDSIHQYLVPILPMLAVVVAVKEHLVQFQRVLEVLEVAGREVLIQQQSLETQVLAVVEVEEVMRMLEQ
jgi:hypothetical protein